MTRAQAHTVQTTPRIGRLRRLSPTAKAKTVLGCVAMVLVVVYCIGCIYFYQRFWPHTTMGGVDVSLMDAPAAQEALERSSQNRSVNLSGQGVSLQLTGANAGLDLDAGRAVDQALAAEGSWQWPIQVLLGHDDSDALLASFDESLLRTTLSNELGPFNSVATDPVDAFLYYDEPSGSYRINPGSVGTKIDVESAMRTVEDALAHQRNHAVLTSENLVQQQVTATDERIVAAQDTANRLLLCNVDLLVDGTVVATVDPVLVQRWIEVGGDGSVWVNDDELNAWVDELEAQIDSVGDTKAFTRPDGKDVTVSGGTYGWISDGDALAQLVSDAVHSGQTGQIEVPLKQSAAAYNPGGADWGQRYVDVDLSEQQIRFYDDYGTLVLSAPVITGAVAVPDCETPQGSFYINDMARDQILVGVTDPETNKPIYETKVKYWMPFQGNLIGLHDAPWQPDWSPDVYLTESGSHGCVNLQPDVAEWAFGWLTVGTPVIVHY